MVSRALWRHYNDEDDRNENYATAMNMQHIVHILMQYTAM